MMDLRDLEEARKMLYRVLETLNPKLIQELKESNS